MTSAQAQRLGRLGAAVAAVAALTAVAGPAAAASALDLYYERSLMVAANGRCRLFDAQLGAALDASAAQARGAALRSGAEEAVVAQVRRRAQGRAESVACRSRDLALAAGRVRQAFEGYSRLQRMTYLGQKAAWQADRAASAVEATWRLSQGSAAGRDPMMFGLAARGPAPLALTATAAFADGRWPYAARLVMRDPVRAPRPSLGGVFAGALDKVPLSRRLPPRSATRVVQADGRNLADTLLLPSGAKTGVSFRFPASASAQLAALDPREAIAVEFVFAGAGRDEVRTAYLEVGDFAAGQAFLNVTPR